MGGLKSTVLVSVVEKHNKGNGVNAVKVIGNQKLVSGVLSNGNLKTKWLHGSVLKNVQVSIFGNLYDLVSPIIQYFQSVLVETWLAQILGKLAVVARWENIVAV